MDMVAYISRAEFRAWAEQQPRGRFERVDGRVVKMQRQTVGHALVKMAVWRALDDAVRAAGLDCQAYPNGVTVEVGEDTDYLPDALVNAGPAPAPDDFAAPNPVVVVEVLSPRASSIDTGEKLSGYFRVPSIQHYLIVCARRREVLHHRRAGEAIITTVLTEGAIAFDPPGISIALDAIYRGRPAVAGQLVSGAGGLANAA
jgi:Uma2 family endonuclease